MKLSEIDYDLPEERIAQTPLEDRAASRLLHLPLNEEGWADRRFRDVPVLLQADDLLVVNDTRVTALRVFGARPTGARVEALLLHEGENPGEYVALMKPGRKLRPGEDVTFEGDLEAKVLEDLGNGRKRLRFAMGAEAVPMLQRVGQTPLPPYIKASLENPERYQTVYAGQAGSAAAPTAGLHFTQEILEALRAKGVRIASVTLDVSIDTFRPVTADDVRDHKIHGETCRVSPETADAVNTCRGRVVAVGTTSVRTLESFAVGRQRVEPGEKVSDLYITPGYEFQAIDGMFTNFHLPKTSMLLMVGALCGVERLMKAYEHAVRSNYRFLSFGDSMLVL